MMDEDEINNLVQGFQRLKYKFHDVFAADNFPLHLSQNSFIIVNVSTSQSIGTPWILICRRNGDYIFADTLGKKLTSYKHLHNRLVSSAGNIQTVYELLRNQPIQKKPKKYCVAYSVLILLIIFLVEKKL